MFILASSVCWSLQYLNSARTQGGHLSRLTPSTVLRGGRNTASKYRWRVWGARAVSGPHWFAPGMLTAGVLPRPTAQAPGCSAGELSYAGQGCVHFPGAQAPDCSAGELSDAGRGCMHFPGLRCSGSRLLCRGTV